MTACQPTDPLDSRQAPFRRSRLDTAAIRADFSDPDDPPLSQRQYAAEHDIPRATLGYLLRQQLPADVEPELAVFLQRPAGERFLRRLLYACLLSFRESGACGLRCVQQFLQRSQLDRFIASSYGALHELGSTLEDQLVLFAIEESKRLTPWMPKQSIVITADEHFHDTRPCLVAIEPASGFILVETYRPLRDSPTWTEAIHQAVASFPVVILYVVSDQAKALIHCAEDGLGVAHAPELFHIQQKICPAVLAPLQRQIKQAQQKVQLDQECVAEVPLREAAYRAEPSVGRPPDFAKDLQRAHQALARSQEELQGCQQRQQRALAAIHALGDDCHPFDRHTGAALEAQQVQSRVVEQFGKLQVIVGEANLGAEASKTLQTTQKWMVLLVATVGWFWYEAHLRVEALDVSPQAEAAIYGSLLAGLYWQQAAARARTVEEQQRLLVLAQELLEAAKPGLASLDAPEKEAVEKAARALLGLFQRSSSCVEGRNGRLSLYRHAQGKISARRLQALTAVHNYVARRPDGSTAAERFFGSKQRDVFEWLLERLPDLPKPASKRSAKPAREAPAAA